MMVFEHNMDIKKKNNSKSNKNNSIIKKLKNNNVASKDLTGNLTIVI